MRNISFVIFIFFCSNIYGQEKKTIFFNQEWEITSYKKAFYYRVTSIDSLGLNYEGDFVDYSLQKKSIIATGRYISNKKEGDFFEYFENGKMKFKGSFKNDNPYGKWFFYYPNGNLKMLIEFLQNDFQILEYADSLSNSTIINGNGNWTTFVDFFGKPTKLVASFKEGKRDGSWEFIDERGRVVLKEKYKDSKLISSVSDGTWDKVYHTRPYIKSTFFIDQKYQITENKICERDLNDQLIPFKRVKKILSLSNSLNLSYLNSQLPVDAILYVTRDNFNNYWFATANSGLIKYDSVFTFYNKSNTKIKGNYISSIAIDKNNKIWFSFGSEPFDYDILTSGLACLYNNEIFVYNTSNSGLTSNSINAIDVDSRNIKWFATFNCILSYDEITKKWNKHFNKKSQIRLIDTVKFKNKQDYISYANKIKSETISYETKSEKSNLHDENFPSPNMVYSTTSYYESPSIYTNIQVLPNNQKLFNSTNSGFGVFDSLNWETYNIRNNIKYIEFVLSRKEQISDSELFLFLYETSIILNTFNIRQVFIGKDNSFWILANNSLYKIKNKKIIEFDLLDKLIRYPADGRIKAKYYYLFSDTDGSLWVTANSAMLKIE